MSHTLDRRHSAQQAAALKALPRVRAPGPLSSTLAFQREPLRFLSGLAQQYDIVQFRLLHLPIIVLNHPALIRRVLVDNQANYDKDVFIFRLLRPIMGNGLVTNVGGELWRQQRRLMQPAFHRSRIAGLGQLMTGITLSMLQGWEEAAAHDLPLNVAEEMMRLTLQIVSRCLFSSDISDQSEGFGRAFARTNPVLTSFARFPFPPLNFPTPSHFRLWAATRKMDTIAYAIIRQRRQREISEDGGDLLSMLLGARDQETGAGMTAQQVRDEVMTLLLAGHETSSVALSWAWYLLSQHPEVERKVYDELDTVLAGRIPTADALPHLPYMRMVIEETIRLYPPTWQLMRRAREEDELGGYRIPAKATLFWSQYVVHRHPAFWENPERFDPERFSPQQVAQRPRYAHIPFGSGPRACIGSSFALMEIQLVMAMIAQRYRLELVPGQVVEPVATLALRPKHGVHVRLVPR